MSSAARQGFSAQVRRDLLTEYFLLWPDDDVEDVEDGYGQQVAAERRAELQDEYRNGVPIIPISRCPFTEEVAYHPLDHFGLEGLFWNADNPIRPETPYLPTFFASTGAVKLNLDEVVYAPFLCKPGPEVPYVVPRVLGHPSTKAVVSSLPIGDHLGFPIAYFARPVPADLLRINTWGTEEYWVPPAQGGGWNTAQEDESQFDYDLASWIEAGKLAWIAPGDRELQLRYTVAGCPYVNLEGHRSMTRIEEAEVWWPEDVLR